MLVNKGSDQSLDRIIKKYNADIQNYLVSILESDPNINGSAKEQIVHCLENICIDAFWDGHRKSAVTIFGRHTKNDKET